MIELDDFVQSAEALLHPEEGEAVPKHHLMETSFPLINYLFLIPDPALAVLC